MEIRGVIWIFNLFRELYDENKRARYIPNGNNADWKKPELKKQNGAFIKALFTIRWFNDINKIGRMISCGKSKTMGIRKIRRIS